MNSTANSTAAAAEQRVVNRGQATAELFAARGGPTVEQASNRYAHGTYARYTIANCRCFRCRVANANYVRETQTAKRGPWRTYCAAGGRGPWTVRNKLTGETVLRCTNRAEAHRERDRRNRRDRPKLDSELIGAGKVRAHLKHLRKQGVGLRTTAASSGVAYSVIERIHSGDIKRTRRRTAAKILAVHESAARGGARIAGGSTWELLDALIAVGYRKGWIALQLGSKTPALQMRNRAVVRADKARAVRALYDRLWADDTKLRTYVDPDGERRRARAQDTEFARKAQSAPLSKRDPAIRRRWDDVALLNLGWVDISRNGRSQPRYSTRCSVASRVRELARRRYAAP